MTPSNAVYPGHFPIQDSGYSAQYRTRQYSVCGNKISSCRETRRRKKKPRYPEVELMPRQRGKAGYSHENLVLYEKEYPIPILILALRVRLTP